MTNGYVCLRAPEHPRADRHGYVYEHVLVAERALGKLLPDGAQVHHVNERKTENVGGNLVVCPDYAYHALLHQRQRALDACGNANWRHCAYCKEYGPVETMHHHQGNSFAHGRCQQKKRREAKARRAAS